MKLLSAQIPLWNRKVKKLIPSQSVSVVQFVFLLPSRRKPCSRPPTGPRVDRYCYTSRHSSMVPGAGGYSVQKSELFVLPVTIREIRRPSSAAIKGVPVVRGSRVSLYYY